jgi:hypothetical protein
VVRASIDVAFEVASLASHVKRLRRPSLLFHGAIIEVKKSASPTRESELRPVDFESSAVHSVDLPPAANVPCTHASRSGLAIAKEPSPSGSVVALPGGHA